MTKSNRIIAVQKGVESGALRELAQIRSQLQKPGLLSGITLQIQAFIGQPR